MFPGDQLVECLELAEEYLLGKMKHACSEYMLTEAENAELNNCLFYLKVAHQFQLTDVENKVLELTYQRYTADVLACANYDVASAAPIIIKHAQWLEERIQLYTDMIHQISALIDRVSRDVTSQVSGLVRDIRHRMEYTGHSRVTCGNGHVIDSKPRGDKSARRQYDEECKSCAYLALQAIKQHLFQICADNIASNVTDKPQFLCGIEKQFNAIKLCWYI